VPCLIQVAFLKTRRRGIDRALMASLMLAALQVAVYITLSAFVLIGRWCSAETDVGLWYGIMVSLTFSLCWSFLPAGLIGQAYVDVVRPLPLRAL
jgi:hypothetical protein